MQNHHAHDRLDAVASTLEHARQSAGFAFEMEAQRELMHVHESAIGKPAHRIHRHLGEQSVTQLRQRRHQDAHATIGNRHGDRRGHRPQQPVRCRDRRGAVTGERVGCPFVREGHRDGRELCGQQQDHGPDHPGLQVATVGRPDIGPEMDEGREQRAAVGGDGRFATGCSMMVMVAH